MVIEYTRQKLERNNTTNATLEFRLLNSISITAAVPTVAQINNTLVPGTYYMYENELISRKKTILRTSYVPQHYELVQP